MVEIQIRARSLGYYVLEAQWQKALHEVNENTNLNRQHTRRHAAAALLCLHPGTAVRKELSNLDSGTLWWNIEIFFKFGVECIEALIAIVAAW